MAIGGLASFVKRAEKLILENSPLILTAMGVTGTLTTAYLTGTASFKAVKVIEEGEREKYRQAQIQPDGSVLPDMSRRAKSPEQLAAETLTTKDKCELVWTLYIPAAVCAGLTVTAMIAANRVGMRRAAALASAYSLSEKMFDQYKEKVREKIGEEKEKEVREEVARDVVRKNPPTKSEVVIINVGDSLFADLWSGRYFRSDMETIRKVVNDFNAKVINETYASLTELWDMLGLSSTAESDEIGWSTDKLLEVDFVPNVSNDGRPCIGVDFRVRPVSRFNTMY